MSLIPDTYKCKCDNCNRVWDESETIEPTGLPERLDIGGEVPSGECRDCGALCFRLKRGTFCIIKTTYKREPPPMLDIWRDDDGWPHLFDTHEEAWEFCKDNSEDAREFQIVMLNEEEEGE